MFGLKLGLGKLGAAIKSGLATWNPQTALWPTGTEPGLWISPRSTGVSFQDSAATTTLSAIGTVADSANPVGAILDKRFGATAIANPGTHLLQATSTARPFASGRVNKLIQTENLSNAAWGKELSSISGSTLIEDTSNGTHAIIDTGSVVGNVTQTFSFIVQPAGRSKIRVDWVNSESYTAVFDLTASGSVSGIFGAACTIIQIGASYYCTFSFVPTFDFTSGMRIKLNNGSTETYTGDGVSGVIITRPQLESGSTATPYQRVNTASDYSLGPLIYDKFDGVDDGWLSGTVAAGVIGNSNMDCLIAVQRDTAANAVCGLYNAIADATKYFGMAESASGSACVGAGAGTPTVWVDNVQLAGGTAVTRGTLHTALTPGVPHILEFRGLDLSTWTAAGFGLYTSYVLPGALMGDGIELFPSATAATRNAARTALAATVGLVL